MKDKKGWQGIVKKLLIVLLAVLTVYMLICCSFFGIYEPLSPAECTFPAGFTCIKYELHQNGELDLEIGQGIGHQIKITGAACTMNLSPEYMNNSNVNNYASDPIEMSYGTSAKISKLGTSHTLICTNEFGNPILDTSKVKSDHGYLQFRLYLNYTEMDTNKSGITWGQLAYRIPVPCWENGPCSCVQGISCILLLILILIWLILGFLKISNYFVSKPKKI
jgi:hypothetical protein